MVQKLKVIEYPTYLLFDKKGNLISTPVSGIAAVENELSGLFGHNVTFKTEKYEELSEKFPYLIIPYTLLVILILLIQVQLFGIKKLIGNKKH